jgi:hypothetical protein
MSDHSEAFVAFDTSKLRNAVAIADGGRGDEVRFLGEFDNTPAATAKLVRKLAAKYERLTFCYEGGRPVMALPADQEPWARVHCGCPLADSEEGRRSGEDEPA